MQPEPDFDLDKPRIGRPTGSKSLPRHKLAKQYEDTIDSRWAMIRRLVLDHNRMDILADYVLGGDSPEWFHKEMMQFQTDNPEGIILGFPGVRKTQYLTICRAIYEIVRNPNIRILFVADAADQAKTFLRGVKSHFENNEELRAIFGDFVNGAEKWSDSEIIVNRRSAIGLKEATITCAGIDTSLIGRHFEIIIADDLVTEENSLTEHQRNRIRNYFYKTLLTRLEPDGRMWVIGQRWHDEDLYGHLQKEDYEDATFIFGVLDESEESVWEAKFPTKRMHRLRRGNPAGFELQWMCRHGVAIGGVFSEDHFRYYDELNEAFFKWQGVDLAAGQKARNDFFAHVTIAVTKSNRDIYLVDFRETKLTFPRQVKFIDSRFRDHPDTVRVGIESNAYQVVMTQQVKEQYPDIPIHRVYTLKDKVARAQQLATLASDKPFYVKRQHHKFIRRLLAFPNGPKDVFDAFDTAVGMGLRGVKKKRDNEPGLI